MDVVRDTPIVPPDGVTDKRLAPARGPTAFGPIIDEGFPEPQPVPRNSSPKTKTAAIATGFMIFLRFKSHSVAPARRPKRTLTLR